MYKPVFAGCDVSKDWIDLCYQLQSGKRESLCFGNSAEGHKQLLHQLISTGKSVRIVLEATGAYSLDLTLALYEAGGVEVMVANPRAAKRFAEAQMKRSKTDESDADSLCSFAQRMPFMPWRPPQPDVLALRSIARRIQALTVEHTRERGRLHHACASNQTPQVVINDIEVNLRHLHRRIDEMTRQAMKIVQDNVLLKEAFERLTSIKGIAQKSAVLLLPELLALPQGLTLRQWVAHAGLDPRQYSSGSSTNRPTRISKVGNVRLRRALYMPALVATKWEPHIRAFYEKLIARGKKPIVAIVAVMRKLLHAIYGMLLHNEDFIGQKFYKIPQKSA